MPKTEFAAKIKQFDIKFRASKEKRKTQEQWILNFTYPDKSSNEYMEYLQDCTDYKNGNYFLIKQVNNEIQQSNKI